MKHRSKRLLDRVRDAIRLKGYSVRTEEAYVGWIKRFILFHDKRHPQEMGYSDIKTFLLHLATEEGVAASTQNQALNGLLFLYREVLINDFELHRRWLVRRMICADSKGQTGCFE